MPARPSAAETGALVHHAVAGELGVLLVQGDRAAAEALVLERPAQHPGAADRQAVVGEAERAGLAQLGHLGQLLALHAARDRGEEADRDRGAARGACSRSASTSAAVETGGSVLAIARIAAVAAGGGGAGAGLDVLLVLVAGGAQVDVGVEEGREGVQALGLDHLGAVGVGLAGRGELGDLRRRG